MSAPSPAGGLQSSRRGRCWIDWEVANFWVLSSAPLMTTAIPQRRRLQHVFITLVRVPWHA